ncbi:13581_t:CDS:1, partial [Racocetra persica]
KNDPPKVTKSGTKNKIISTICNEELVQQLRHYNTIPNQQSTKTSDIQQ